MPIGKIFVRDSALIKQGEVTDFQKIQMIPRFNDVGSWMIEKVPESDPMVPYLVGNQPGIIIADRAGNSLMSGPVMRHETYTDDQGVDYLNFYGIDDNVILARRLGLPNPTVVGQTGMFYQDEVLFDDPIVFLRFSERSYASGQIIHNTALSGIQWTCDTSMPTPQAGSIITSDNAWDYHAQFGSGGTAKYIYALNASQHPLLLFSLGESITIEAWIYIEAWSPGGSKVIVARGGSPLGWTFLFYVLQTGELRFLYTNPADGSNQIYDSAAGSIPLTQWKHVAVTFTYGKPASMKLYINGVQVPGTWIVGTGLMGPLNVPTATYVGTYAGAGEFMVGRIDEVAIYRSALSSGRIKAHYVSAGRATQGNVQDVRSGVAETAIKDYINYNAGPGALAGRSVTGLTIASNLGRGTTVYGAARFQFLIEVLQDLAIQGGGLGFRIRQPTTAAQLVFDIYVPVDRSAAIKFSKAFHNLRSYRYTVEAPKGNYLYTGGQGEGNIREIVEVSDAASITKWGRIERFYDQRNIEGSTELLAQATAGLSEFAEKTGLSIEPADTSYPIFGTDYDLGDKVQVVIRNASIIQPISEAVIELTPDGETVKPAIGKVDQNALDSFFARIREGYDRLINVERY